MSERADSPDASRLLPLPYCNQHRFLEKADSVKTLVPLIKSAKQAKRE